MRVASAVPGRRCVFRWVSPRRGRSPRPECAHHSALCSISLAPLGVAHCGLLKKVPLHDLVVCRWCCRCWCRWCIASRRNLSLSNFVQPTCSRLIADRCCTRSRQLRVLARTSHGKFKCLETMIPRASFDGLCIDDSPKERFAHYLPELSHIDKCTICKEWRNNGAFPSHLFIVSVEQHALFTRTADRGLHFNLHRCYIWSISRLAECLNPKGNL